jgi:hypothetical protein
LGEEGADIRLIGDAGAGPGPTSGLGRVFRVLGGGEGIRAAQQRGRSHGPPGLALGQRRRLVRLIRQRLFPAGLEQPLLGPVGIVPHEGADLGGAGLIAREQAVVGDELACHRIGVLRRHGVRLIPVMSGDRIHRRLTRYLGLDSGGQDERQGDEGERYQKSRHRRP